MNACEDLQRALITKWAATTAVGISLYYNRANKDATVPYAVFYIDSTFERLFGGRIQPVTIQFNIFTATPSSESLNDYVEAIKTKFDTVKLTLAGGNTMMVPMMLESENIFVNDTNHWQATLIFAATLR